MKYIYIDGDDIGLKIEKSFMTNDEENLQVINYEVSRAVAHLTTYLSNEDYEIIFSGADGIILKAQIPRIDNIFAAIAAIETSLTFSIGVGNSLREAFLALRYAKANGKNGVAILDHDFTWKSNRDLKISSDRSAFCA